MGLLFRPMNEDEQKGQWAEFEPKRLRPNKVAEADDYPCIIRPNGP